MIESTANTTIVEVDEAVKERDPTGGRGVNGEIRGKMEANGKSEEEVLESAV